MAAVIGVCVMIGAAGVAADFGGTGPQAGDGQPSRRLTPQPRAASVRCPDHRRGLRYYRQRHAYWTSRLVSRGSAVRMGRAPRSCPDARYLAVVWRKRAARARKLTLRHLERQRAYRFRLLYEKWRCIHEHEGAWNANTGNGYYGGLQMDSSFYWTYGPEFARRWGTPDRWPVWAQLLTAERAYQTRGFGPWPNTARMCGLL